MRYGAAIPVPAHGSRPQTAGNTVFIMCGGEDGYQLGAIKFLEVPRFQSRLRRIIFEDEPVKSISDIHRVFKTDLNTSFKTVFKWDL